MTQDNPEALEDEVTTTETIDDAAQAADAAEPEPEPVAVAATEPAPEPAPAPEPEPSFATQSRFTRMQNNTAYDARAQSQRMQAHGSVSNYSSEEDGYKPYTGYYAPSQQVYERIKANQTPLNVRVKKSRSGSITGLLIAIVVLGALIGGGVWLWFNRQVEVTVNGIRTDVRYHSSLTEVADVVDLAVTPGNLVSVKGELLRTGEGHPFSAAINEVQLMDEQLYEYKVEGGEEILMYDGNDKMEEYDVTPYDVQPKLVRENPNEWGPIQYVAQWGKAGQIEVRVGKVSGDWSTGAWIVEAQDCIIRSVNPTPSDGRKLVCLTFDDGPSPTYTQQYIDILKKYGAKGTFFNLGCEAAAYPAYSALVTSNGMQLCSHTYNHQDLITLDLKTVYNEIKSAYDALEAATGTKTATLRPPYGDWNLSCWLASYGTTSVMVSWTQDSEDWELDSVDEIVDRALDSIGNGSIILMHDGGGSRELDLQALPKIIERLQDQGYELVTISELLASDDSIPEDIATCTATLPDDCVWPTEIAE